MPQLIVRNLTENVKDALQKRARRHGHSMEEEARAILRQAVISEKRQTEKLGTWFLKNFSGTGLSKDIPEFHGQFIAPARFDE